MPGPGTPEVPVTGAIAPGAGSPGSVLPRTTRNTSVMPGNLPGPLGGGPNGPVGPKGPGGRGPGGGSGGDGGSGKGGSGKGGASGDGKDEKPASDLSVNKVVAGAGAAIVTAILGSFLGAVGTILGAALGSIITTVATTFFQRSIDVTRTKVVGTTQRIKERKGGPGGTAVWQAAAQDGGTGLAGPDGQETVLLDPSATSTRPPGKGRHWTRVRMTRKQVVWSVVGAVLAFGLAMFLVTGIEWIKGGTITGGGTGTSIGNVVSGSAPRTTENTDTGSSDSTSTSESSTSTSEPDSSSSSTATSDPSSTSENGNGSGDSGSSSSNPLQDGLNRVLPSQQPESGQQQSGQSGSGGNSGGGAASSN
ncbi:hypothetical protein EV383_5666 [Pseudonocardia sediminis]|uniref:Uncharacterized protein n=2 Tax=Pseudonocardia sediminis TaxID=1397368 RepID=A0A4Q7V583_PSEST|nr:hypothetical protein EV383_5666 [Pseudonocardia sediminis]